MKGWITQRDQCFDGFNSVLWSSYHQPNYPLWFPEPHPLSDWLMLHKGTVRFKASGPARTWYPPYSSLITSTSPSTGRKRWLFVYQFWAFLFNRPRSWRLDPSILPLTKSQWRDVTSWVDFEKGWPTGEEHRYAFSEDNYWSYGHEKVFGVQLTKKAVEAYRNGQPCPILPNLMSCGHSIRFAQWDDPKLKNFIALKYAEGQLLQDFALIDPVLSTTIDGYDGRIPIAQHGQVPSNSEYGLRLKLVLEIVYFEGQDSLRGWERTKLEEYRRWAAVLAGFLGPLWRAHPKMQKENLLGWEPARVTDVVVSHLSEMHSVQRCVQVMLLFWLQVLISDHGQLPAPFYPSPKGKPTTVCSMCSKPPEK